MAESLVCERFTAEDAEDAEEISLCVLRVLCGEIFLRTILSNKSPQELNAGGDVAKAIIAGFLFDDQPSSIINFLEYAQVAHPFDIAVAERYELTRAVGAGLAGVLGMAVDDAAG